MSSMMVSRIGLICLSFSITSPVLGSDDGVIGNLETVRYLLRASEAFEQAAARSKGRMRAKFIRKDGPEGTTNDRWDMETTLECVWDGANSLRKVTEDDFGMQRRLRIAGRLKESETMVARFRLLLTTDRAIRVHDGLRDSKKHYVNNWPRQNMDPLPMDWLVLPAEDAWKVSFQVDTSQLLKVFIDFPANVNPKPIREIVEDGDRVVLTIRHASGAAGEYTFSHEWGGRLVAYSAIPDRKTFTLKENGTMTWSRDAHGEVYLREHIREASEPGKPGSITTKWTFKIEDYDSQPVIDPREFTLGSLNLPDDSEIHTFGSSPHVPIARGTLGGQPITHDKNKQFNELVEQLKTRGFARPDRAK